MERVWWEKVPNALSYKTDIVNRLLDEKSLIINSNEKIPWKSYLVRSIKESVKQYNSTKRFEEISGIDNPGEFLLNKYCKKEKRAQYRPTKGYVNFLAESDDIVVHERYFWINITSKENLEVWTDFVSAYINKREKNKSKAVFILDLVGISSYIIKKGITLFSFDDYINDYDRILFSMLCSSAIKEPLFLKNYLSELVSSVIGNRIEMCAELIQEYKNFLEEPYKVVCRIVCEKTDSDGEKYNFKKTPEAVDYCVWKAQVKTVYPAIEEFRKDFVQSHISSIESQLPISSAFGEIVEDPGDVELGSLKYMSDCGMLLLDYEERSKLRAYTDARNKLSHLRTLSFLEIQLLYS